MKKNINDEIFHFLSIEFNVSLAYKLILWKEIKFIIDDVNVVNSWKRFTRIYDEIMDENKDKKIDLTKPIWIVIDLWKDNMILIDGNHRMQRLYNESIKICKIYYIDCIEDIFKFSNLKKFKNKWIF